MKLKNVLMSHVCQSMTLQNLNCLWLHSMLITGVLHITEIPSLIFYCIFTYALYCDCQHSEKFFELTIANILYNH